MSNLSVGSATSPAVDWFARSPARSPEANGAEIDIPQTSMAASAAGQSAPAGDAASAGNVQRSAEAVPAERAKETSIINEFLKWAHMSPAERIRAQYLEEHGLTEESFEAQPKEARDAMALEIAARIQDALGGNGDPGSSRALGKQATAAYQQATRLVSATFEQLG